MSSRYLPPAAAASARPTESDHFAGESHDFLSPQNRGLDLPLHALLRGRGAVHGHRAHAAGTGAVSHEPGVELSGLARREPEQQVELALGEGLRPIDTLVRDDEVTLVGGSASEGALGCEVVEEAFHL